MKHLPHWNWTFDKIGAGGWIVEVITKLFTPILTYAIFVICHIIMMRYDIYVKNNRCHYWCQSSVWTSTIQPQTLNLPKCWFWCHLKMSDGPISFVFLGISFNFIHAIPLGKMRINLFNSFSFYRLVWKRSLSGHTIWCFSTPWLLNPLVIFFSIYLVGQL